MRKKASQKKKFLIKSKKFFRKFLRTYKKIDINRFLSRGAFVSLVLFLWLIGPGFIGITASYYNDSETSFNKFQAGVVDIELLNKDFETSESSINFGSGTTTSKIIEVSAGLNSGLFLYNASTTEISGDIDFCNEINFDLELNGQFLHSGDISSFVSSTTSLVSTSSPDILNFIFKTSEEFSIPNSICNFEFTFDSTQSNPEVLDGGFFDFEKVNNTIVSWGLRINKVYYDVASDRGEETINEWVEIYNQTDKEIDISGWQICDNTHCDIIPTSNLIPPKGFAVITPSESTWNYWERDSGVVSVVLGNPIGGGLANGGDILVLKRPDGIIIDQMNWGIPNVEWVNYNSNIWTPGPIAPEGYALARKPSGYDTDSSSDFVSLAPPSIELLYPDQSGELVWYWTYDYEILWDAINPNGDNEDLLIDLFYIKDSDGSESITENDEIISIAEKITNTGKLLWTVPSGFLGYIWLKIVAFAPENPMLNSRVISGKIYDPAPIEIMLSNPQDSDFGISGALKPILDDNFSNSEESENESDNAENQQEYFNKEIIEEENDLLEIKEDNQVEETLDVLEEESFSDQNIIPGNEEVILYKENNNDENVVVEEE